MRVPLATLALVFVASCSGGDDPNGAPRHRASPAPPESPIAPRAAPRETPEFCQCLWSGLYDRGGIITPYSDERRYEPTTLAAARDLLETARTWVGAWVPGAAGEGAASDAGRAFHRLRESPDALAHFEHLYDAGPDGVAALYAACGFAELDRGRYADALGALRASHAHVSVMRGDMVEGSALAAVVDDGAFGRLFVTPGGFETARRRDGFFAHDPGRMQIVRSLDPFVPGGDGSMRDIAARRILRAIEHDARLSEYVPPREVFSSTWRATIEVRGDALEVQLAFSARERFAVRFSVDAETGEARDVREIEW